MDQRDLKIILKLQDEATADLRKFVKDVENAENGVNSFGKKLEDLQPGFKKMAAIGTAGFVAITGAIATSIKETIEAQAAQNRLTHIIQTATGATDKQVEALLEQADALEKIGVVSSDSIVQAQAQLATFDLQAESIERLTPAILDYVVAEKGATASTEDLKQLTNGLAQALNGNFASLTRTGFVLDDATKALIENGTEAERTAALVKVLNSTYAGFNASARNTAEGSLIVLRNEFNNLREAIGDVFLPVLADLNQKIIPVIETTIEWAKSNPELVKQIGIVSLAVSGFTAAVGILGLTLPSIIAGFTFLASPIGLVALAVLSTVAALTFLRNDLANIFQIIDEKTGLITLMREAWENIVATFWESLVPAFMGLWEQILPLKPFLLAIAEIIGATLTVAIATLVQIIQGWVMLMTEVLAIGMKLADWLIGPFVQAWDNTTTAISRVVDIVERLIDRFKQAISLAGKVTGSAGDFLIDKVGGGINKVLKTVSPFAEGGIVTGPTLGLVGEAGPEAIIPLSKMDSMGGGITINVYGDVSGQELIDKVTEALGMDIKRRIRI